MVLVFTAIFLAYIAMPFFGNKALIVKSGSMFPKIKTGDLVVVNFQNNISTPQSLALPLYKTGDVIAFNSLNTIITHRVVGTEVKNRKVFYITKGDANNTPDVNLTPQENVLGKSTMVIPFLGKVFAAAKSKNGFLLLIIFPALAVIFTESLNLYREFTKVIKARRFLQEDPKEKIENQKLMGPIGIRVLLPFVIGTMFFHNSFAFFTDSASSLNNTFTSARVFPFPSPSPTNIANHIVISEVQITGGPTHTTEDFIELYNPTSSAINLSGFRLVNRVTASSSDNSIRVFTASNVIPTHGYFLWCSTTEAALITCDDTTGDTLSNDGSVALKQGPQETETTIDSLSWDSSVNSLKEGTEFSPDPTANQSIERKAYLTSTASSMTGVDSTKGNGFDTNNNSTDFALRAISDPQNSSSPIEIP